MTESTRSHPRVTVEIAAEVAAGDNVLLAATRNLSTGGVCLDTEQAIDKGTSVGITLFLTLDGIEDADVEPFEAQAEGVWCTERAAGAYTAGARFGQLRPEELRRLQEFLDLVQAQGMK